MNEDYATAFTVDQSPEEVFKAISNVRGWWSEDIEGDTDKLGSIFFQRYQDVHRGTFKITEFELGKRIVWHVLQNYFNFVKNSTEWTGTDIVFDITKKGNGKTELHFTHVGLKPSQECYGVCRDAWNFHIRHSLHDLITEGRGEPTKK